MEVRRPARRQDSEIQFNKTLIVSGPAMNRFEPVGLVFQGGSGRVTKESVGPASRLKLCLLSYANEITKTY